jgi:single-strand DNA-binding protein
MAGVNKVILLGNLGQDPEVRYLENGAVVARVSLATTESYKDKEGNRVDNTEWHDVELWDNLAKIAEKYLKKGDSIYLEGKIKTDKWTDKEGNNRKTTRIRGINMTLLPKASGGAPAENRQPAAVAEPMPQSASYPEYGDSDDLPF